MEFTSINEYVATLPENTQKAMLGVTLYNFDTVYLTTCTL